MKGGLDSVDSISSAPGLLLVLSRYHGIVMFAEAWMSMWLLR